MGSWIFCFMGELICYNFFSFFYVFKVSKLKVMCMVIIGGYLFMYMMLLIYLLGNGLLLKVRFLVLVSVLVMVGSVKS